MLCFQAGLCHVDRFTVILLSCFQFLRMFLSSLCFSNRPLITLYETSPFTEYERIIWKMFVETFWRTSQLRTQHPMIIITVAANSASQPISAKIDLTRFEDDTNAVPMTSLSSMGGELSFQSSSSVYFSRETLSRRFCRPIAKLLIWQRAPPGRLPKRHQ